jgi:deoxyribonuclease-4
MRRPDLSNLTMKKSTPDSALPRLGAHMSIAGGVQRAIERGARVGCQTIQIFLKSNVQWEAKPYSAQEVRAFRELQTASGIRPVFAHGCYLINLAAADEQVYARSVAALADEIHRADQLGLPFVVIHPGSHLGRGEAAGLRQVAQALKEILIRTAGCAAKIALETTAGQGSNLGHRFEHLAEIIERADGDGRLAVCLDTCHVFAAGYDIGAAKGCEKVFAEFERVIGFDRLVALHLNDSKNGLGSRLDRHEHIGKGKIGREGFRWIVNDARLQRLPMVLETPKGKDLKEDADNLRVLRSFVRRDSPRRRSLR